MNTALPSSSLHLEKVTSLPAVTGPSTARRPAGAGAAGGGAAPQPPPPQPLTARRPSDNVNNGGGAANHHNNNTTTTNNSNTSNGFGLQTNSANNTVSNLNLTSTSNSFMPPVAGASDITAGLGNTMKHHHQGSTTANNANSTSLLPPIGAASSSAGNNTNAPEAAGVGANGSSSVPATAAAGGAAGAVVSDVVSFQHCLTAFEKQEVMSFAEKYYFGQNCTSKVQSPVAGGINFGYDDDRGDYNLIMYDHVSYRYEIVGFLGKGSFGQVAKVFDHKRQTLMALKVLRNKKKFHQQAQVEIKVLQHLRHRDPDGKYGIVQIHDTFTFRNHICLTYELLSINLYEYLKNNKFTPMPLPVVKKIGASVLISLAFMWREGIIHCDLKPENILLRQPNRTGVKVIDLGSACFENERLYTYIQSRFYRAPEVILGIPYTRRIDLWSYACVLCELATGIPIFPGESETEQIALIMEYLNVPPPEIIQMGPHRGKFFETNGAPKLVPNSRKKVRMPNTKTIHGFLGLPADDLFVSFIKLFLTWDPEERPSPEAAMRHPWICDAYVGLTPTMPAVKRRFLPVGERGKDGGGSISARNSSDDNKFSVPTSPRVITTSGSDKPSSSRRQRKDGAAGGGEVPSGAGGPPKLPSVPQPKNKNPRKVPM